MNLNKFKSILVIGETSSVEFKRGGNEVEHDVFESICSFLNRFGGDIFLGVLNDGTVEGVNPANAAAMMKNIINVVNNPNVFRPSPYIEIESFNWEGRTIIHVHVPVSGDVHSYKGDIFDRVGEVDVKVRATDQIADLYLRKKGIYTEREVYPNLTLADLRTDLLPRLRIEAQNHITDGRRHPWIDMNDLELLQSASLIGEDKLTGRTGFNLAAVLLLGKDETLARICPQYATDAIFRVVNVDRYDDRKIVKTNLLESQEELMLFARNHLPDPFFLEGSLRISLREIIVREMVTNILMHREFTSSAYSQFVIERERMFTRNPCVPFHDGEVRPGKFSPRAKNPIIAAFFRELGRADQLGSGVRNLFKYCGEYGGGEPRFEEGDEFVISVSLKKLDAIRFPFEKPHIDQGKPHIDQKKPHIDQRKPRIGGGGVHLEELVSEFELSRPTAEHIVKLYGKFGVVHVFGRREVMSVTGLKERTASELIGQLLRKRLVDTVTGQGKGKYRFRDFTKEVQG